MPKKAFTLIELMIVVAIMAILAMIAVAQYNSYITRSRNAATSSLLQQLALAQIACHQLNSSQDFIEIKNTSDTAQIATLAGFGFRPDPNIGFVALNPTTPGTTGFIAFAAHRVPGSPMFTYNFITHAGVQQFDSTTTYPVTVPTTLHIFSWEGASDTASFSSSINVNSNGIVIP